jgi:hypothetical protein
VEGDYYYYYYCCSPPPLSSDERERGAVERGDHPEISGQADLRISMQSEATEVNLRTKSIGIDQNVLVIVFYETRSGYV